MKAKAVGPGDAVTTVEEQHAEDLDNVEKLIAEEDRIFAGEDGPYKAEPIVLTVRRQYKEEGDLVIDPEEETEEIAIQDFYVEPAHSSLKVNHTLNMGQYWSASVQVGINVPHYREEHEAAFKFVAKTVAERLAKEIVKAKDRTEELRSRRGPGSDLF